MIDKSDLLRWLKKLDNKLNKSVTIIAVGGTAMTLLGLKSSTKDIDLCLNLGDKADFEKILDKEFHVHLFIEGYIFSEQLPEDYIAKSKEITQLKNITLKVLSPVDIIIIKTARLNARDEEDIQTLAKYVDKEELIRRFKEVVPTYSGNEDDYWYNFNIVLKVYFK